MTPNPFLSNYTSEEIDSLIKSGSIQYRYDDSSNLLIDQTQTAMASSSITIPLYKKLFSDTKVETKYDVIFNELS